MITTFPGILEDPNCLIILRGDLLLDGDSCMYVSINCRCKSDSECKGGRKIESQDAIRFARGAIVMGEKVEGSRYMHPGRIDRIRWL